MSTLTKDELKKAFILKRLVEHIAEPDGHTSPGAEFLIHIAETWEETRHDYDDFSYLMRDVASTTVPVSDYEVWRVFTDLCAYQYAAEMGIEGAAEKGETLTDMARKVLCWIVYDLIEALNVSFMDED
jgi:hypothetical protein